MNPIFRKTNKNPIFREGSTKPFVEKIRYLEKKHMMMNLS